ncbi:hypothetical protein C4577_04850, partial [Candidatus Parcubacteria bacterium]
MGLFVCDLCGFQGGLGCSHECKKEDIRKHAKYLDLEKRTAEDHLEKMKNAVLMILKNLPSLEGNKIEVSGDWLRKLWNATENQWYEAKTADDFITCWMVTHRIL